MVRPTGPGRRPPASVDHLPHFTAQRFGGQGTEEPLPPNPPPLEREGGAGSADRWDSQGPALPSPPPFSGEGFGGRGCPSPRRPRQAEEPGQGAVGNAGHVQGGAGDQTQVEPEPKAADVMQVEGQLAADAGDVAV